MSNVRQQPTSTFYAPDLYTRALAFAAQRHAHQTVPGTNLPYLVHLVSVASEVIVALAAEPRAQPDVAMLCALLHDTIEDTQTTYDEVHREFGLAVADGVQALSKQASLPKHEQMADSLRRIKNQPAEVWMVKLADRIVNLGKPPATWNMEKRRFYRDEASFIVEMLGAASATLSTRLHLRIAAYPVDDQL